LDDLSDLLVGAVILACVVAPAGFAEDLRKILEPQPSAVPSPVEAGHDQRVLAANGIHRERIDFGGAEHGGGPAKAERFVANERAEAIGIELGNVGRGTRRIGGDEASAGPDDEKLLLNAGDGAAGVRRHFDKSGLPSRQRFSGRADADGADAVSAVAQQQPQIVFLGDMAQTRLLLTYPAFRAEMLEEWVEALLPFIFAARGREAAGNAVAPACGVSEA